MVDQEEESNGIVEGGRGRLWCSTNCSEDDVLNSVVLCSAMIQSNTEADLITCLQKSENSIFLPVLEYDRRNKVVVETPNAILCAIGMSEIVWDLLSIKQTEFQYGAALHGPFLNRVKQIQVERIINSFAKPRQKKLIFCGHSLAGSIAQLCAIEALYQSLPLALQRLLVREDWEEAPVKQWIEQNPLETAPKVQAIGFGSTHVGSERLGKWIRLCGWETLLVTIVNQMDCIPGILNLTQSASLITRTTTRVWTLVKATKSLLKFVVPMESTPFVFFGSKCNALLNSPYAIMLLSGVNRLIRTIQQEIQLDFKYMPCGTYVLLDCDSKKYHLSIDSMDIQRNMLEMSGDTLVADNILHHGLVQYEKNIRLRMDRIRVSISAELNHYERLHLQPTATLRDIRSAYRSLALKWHPDRWSSRSVEQRKEAEEVFKLLAESFEVLSNRELREQYDADLARGKSGTGGFGEELYRKGTVGGMTVDEAIAKFSQVMEQCTSTFSSFQNPFRSSSTAVTQASSIARGRFQSGNHENMFLANKMRVARDVAGSAEKKMMYVDADELLPSDVAVRGGTSMRAVSVVGGAVAISAGVAVLVGMWSKYSESTCKARQADALSRMKPEYLVRLLQDRPHTASKTIGVSESTDIVSTSTEDECIDDFYDCVDRYAEAAWEADLESDFFDCLEAESVIVSGSEPFDELKSLCQVGNKVGTPFGIGVVVNCNRSDGIVTCLCDGKNAYIHPEALERASCVTRRQAESRMILHRQTIVSQLVDKYQLSSETLFQSSGLWDLLQAGKVGAIDGGLRAAGGVAISKGVGRFVQPLASYASAPLALASILVDIGKEYIDYRTQMTQRSENAMISKASEQILMREFRQNVGHHIVSGSAAAAGAGISAMTLSSAVSYFSAGTAALTGPIGMLAATGVAVVGGVLGYYSGATLYHKTTSMYFKSDQRAKEDIHRLEYGAKVLFSEYDTSGSGYISCEDCEALVLRLQAASKGSVSDAGIVEALEYLRYEERRSRPISWDEFWDWVSVQALARLESLHAGPFDKNTMYPSVFTTLGYKLQSDSKREVPIIIRAKLEQLADEGIVTESDEYQLMLLLESGSDDEREKAVKTIDTLIRSLDANEVSEGFDSSTDRNCDPAPVMISEADDQLDVLCSLLSTDGIRRLLEDHGIDTSELSDHASLHSVALTLAEYMKTPLQALKEFEN